MALRTKIAAVLAAITLGLFAGSAAEAKTRVVIGVGNVGWGVHSCWGGWRRHCGWKGRNHYYRHGYRNKIVVHAGGFGRSHGYGHGYVHARRGKGMSCGRAAGIVDRNGYSAVRINDCRGDVYSFNARKHGKFYRVRVNSHTGRIVGSGRL